MVTELEINEAATSIVGKTRMYKAMASMNAVPIHPRPLLIPPRPVTVPSRNPPSSQSPSQRGPSIPPRRVGNANR